MVMANPKSRTRHYRWSLRWSGLQPRRRNPLFSRFNRDVSRSVADCSRYPLSLCSSSTRSVLGSHSGEGELGW